MHWDAPFYACVHFLEWLAALTGLSYRAVNVILFVWAWPLATLGLFAYCLVLRRRQRRPYQTIAQAAKGDNYQG